MSIALPKLPFALDALEPHMSRETLEFHYGRHHKTYVEKTNKLLEGSQLKDASLEEIVTHASGGLYNNAAQAWNHNFFWNCLSPDRPKADKAVTDALSRSFGDLDSFMDQFSEQAVSLFGSGWTWLVRDEDGALDIMNTGNAGNPLTEQRQPLLVCDLWEHAYYLDHRNDRLKYLKNFWPLVNWEFVGQNLAASAPARRSRTTHTTHRGMH
jgi:Fe-Mn family superoxide dismutase